MKTYVLLLLLCSMDSNLMGVDYGAFSPGNLLPAPVKASPYTHFMAQKDKLKKCATAANKIIEEAKMIGGRYELSSANYELKYNVSKSGHVRNVNIRVISGRDLGIMECIKQEIGSWSLDKQDSLIAVKALLHGSCNIKKISDSSFNKKWSQTCKLNIYPQKST